jgi:POT family proton-dependent oligopeptide transporter
MPRVFGWFYFSINFGSMVSTLLTPVLLRKFGPHIAFGVPGFLMLMATWFFWLGRNRFVHIPPAGKKFLEEALSKEGLQAFAKLLLVYAFIAIFWSLYDQTGSSWVLQAEKMNRNWLGFEWTSDQLQAINPILILIYIPLFTYVITPAINKIFPLTDLRKIGIGLFLTVLSFLVCARAEQLIVAGQTPSVSWQVLAYLVITAAEVYVSITGLEFSYKQAPKRLKSLVMGLFFLSVSAGNLFAGLVNKLIQNPDGTSKLPGPAYFLFFAGVMLVAAILFVFVAMRFKEKTYIQDEEGGPGKVAAM